MEREHIDHAAVAIEAIDRALEEPPVSVEEAIRKAVDAGRMTVPEAVECMEAYRRSFGGHA